MKKLSHKFGYTVYGSVTVAEFEKVAQQLQGQVGYAIIGGAAVNMHTSQSRQVTNDIDILHKGQTPKITGYKRATKNTFGDSFEFENFDVDFLKAHSKLELDAVVHAVVIQGVRVVSKAHLICLKYLSGRDKDESDLHELLKDSEAREAAHLLMLKYHSVEAEDFESSMLLHTLY